MPLPHAPQVPRFSHKAVDLPLAWRLVQGHGGYDAACRGKKWAAIGRHFNPSPTCTNLSYQARVWG